MLAFPLAQVPSTAEAREQERKSLVQEATQEDAASFLQEIVEEVEFDYALHGRIQGAIPGLNEEEDEDDRENPFSAAAQEDLPIAQALDEDVADPVYQGEDEQEAEPEVKAKFNRLRIKAQHLEGDESILAQLVKHGLLSKLTQLVLLKAKVPYHLKDEAAQEVQVTWALLKAHPDFARNQMARYAYLSGEHAALKVMRALGAVVSLPSSLFSKSAKDVKGANAKFLQYIGAATNPHDIEDYSDSLEVSDALIDSWEREVVSLSFFKAQMQQIDIKPKHYKIAEMFLVDRYTVDDIAEKLKLTVKYVERSMHLVADALNARSEKQSIKREDLSVKRQNALRKKGIVGAAQGAEAIAISGRSERNKDEDYGLFDGDKSASRRSQGLSSDDDVNRTYSEEIPENALSRRRATASDDDWDSPQEPEDSIKRRVRSTGDTEFEVERNEAVSGIKRRKMDKDDSGWDIAEMPDMYDVEYVVEKPLSSAAMRRQSLGREDSILEAVLQSTPTEDESTSWTVDDLLEYTEQEHKRFSSKDIALEVDAVSVDHFEFE